VANPKKDLSGPIRNQVGRRNTFKVTQVPIPYKPASLKKVEYPGPPKPWFANRNLPPSLGLITQSF